MYQHICDFFQSIPFFSSAAFGIIAMLIYGGSWSLTGLFLGNAPKKGFEAAVMIVVGNFMSAIFSLVVMVVTGAYSTAGLVPTLWTIAAFFASGVLVFIQQKLISVAMQNGPNGAIWAIIQSAFICPFIVGVIFYDNAVKLPHWGGLFFMIAALVLFAFSKDNSSKGGNLWKYLAFIGFAVTGLQQSVNQLPSYYPSTFGVSVVEKSIALASGICAAYVVWMLINGSKNNLSDIKTALRNKTFWWYIAINNGGNILLAYFFFYPGLNIMSEKGLGSMCYMMMVGACIVAFSFISLFIIREKITFIQLAALIACLCGIGLMCI